MSNVIFDFVSRVYKFVIRRIDRTFGKLYDLRKGIHTEFVQFPDELGIESPHKEHAVEYQPTPSFLFSDLLAPVGGDVSELTFVDLGCGPGRTLFLAKDLGFRECIGVELSPLLCRSARRNIDKLPNDEQSGISIVESDAAEFEFPKDDVVIFMFEPFEREVMTKVAQQLVASSKQPRKRTTIIYYHPSSDWIFDDGASFTRLSYPTWSRWKIALFAEHGVSAFALT